MHSGFSLLCFSRDFFSRELRIFPGVVACGEERKGVASLRLLGVSQEPAVNRQRSVQMQMWAEIKARRQPYQGEGLECNWETRVPGLTFKKGIKKQVLFRGDAARP